MLQLIYIFMLCNQLKGSTSKKKCSINFVHHFRNSKEFVCILFYSFSKQKLNYTTILN